MNGGGIYIHMVLYGMSRHARIYSCIHKIQPLKKVELLTRNPSKWVANQDFFSFFKIEKLK